MAATGRPTKLDDLTAKRICDAIATGNTRRCAATAAGVSYATIKQWVRRGRAGEEPFAAFLARLEKADAEDEAKAVKGIVDAAQAGTWQAAAWWLERRRSDRWARREAASTEERERRHAMRLETATREELVRAALSVVSPDELRTALAEAEARTSGGGGAS
jgi:transposase